MRAQNGYILGTANATPSFRRPQPPPHTSVFSSVLLSLPLGRCGPVQPYRSRHACVAAAELSWRLYIRATFATP